jgi:hypothetical protein
MTALPSSFWLWLAGIVAAFVAFVGWIAINERRKSK